MEFDCYSQRTPRAASRTRNPRWHGRHARAELALARCHAAERAAQLGVFRRTARKPRRLRAAGGEPVVAPDVSGVAGANEEHVRSDHREVREGGKRPRRVLEVDDVGPQDGRALPVDGDALRVDGQALAVHALHAGSEGCQSGGVHVSQHSVHVQHDGRLLVVLLERVGELAPSAA